MRWQWIGVADLVGLQPGAAVSHFGTKRDVENQIPDRRKCLLGMPFGTKEENILAVAPMRQLASLRQMDCVMLAQRDHAGRNWEAPGAGRMAREKLAGRYVRKLPAAPFCEAENAVYGRCHPPAAGRTGLTHPAPRASSPILRTSSAGARRTRTTGRRLCRDQKMRGGMTGCRPEFQTRAPGCARR